MGAKGLIVLARAIKVMAKLAHVNLSGNKVTGSHVESDSCEYDSDITGLVALGESVAASTTITSFDFSNCYIGATGTTEIAKLIAGGAELAHIVLSGNMITGSTGVMQPDAKYDLDLAGITALGQAAAGHLPQ